MVRKTILILGVAFVVTVISSELIFSQETNVATNLEEMMLSETPLPEPDVLWLWGEVVTIDTEKKELLVKYLEYETDQEKQIAIAIDDQTTYENINTFAELKPKDTASVDYIIGPEGKNIAKNISVEKSQAENVEAQGTSTEVLPEEITPEAPIENTILNNQVE